MNIIGGLIKAVTDPTYPPHVGEVNMLWALYVATAESRAFCLLMLNHTSDPDLKDTIEHFIADFEEPTVQRLSDVIKNEGIPIPPITADKSKANERDVPPGAKMTDSEIANLLVIKLEGMLMLAHTGVTQSLRDDFGAMFLSIYNHAVAQGFTLKKTMRKRGWLKIPPPYIVGKESPHT